MKKGVWITGVVAALLLAFLLTGAADTGNAVKKALRDGNERYGAAEYEEALQSYEAGLAASPEDSALNYNAAQAAYALEDYEKAASYYEKSEESIQKYINAGNAGYKLGEAAGDAEGKIRYYSRALQAYREGIEKYPRDVPLKYNYELTQEKIRELLEETEQENADENQGEEGEPGGDQSREEQDEDGESREQESSDDNEENAESEQQQDAGQGKDESADSSSREDWEQDAESREDSEQGEENLEIAGQQDINEQDREAIARILEILERQEEEGLKNNREVVREKGDQYGW